MLQNGSHLVGWAVGPPLAVKEEIMAVVTTDIRTKAEKANFVSNMIRLQEENNVASKDLAEMIGVSSNYISKIRCGRTDPTDRIAKSLSELFGVKIDALYVSKEEADRTAWEKYGRKLKAARRKRGMSVTDVSKYLGCTNLVYEEMEAGKCSTSDSFKEKLSKLFFNEPVVYHADTEIRLMEKAKSPASSQKAENQPVILSERPSSEGISIEVADVIVRHVKDLNVSTDIQRKVFRELSAYLLRIQEEKLFG